MTEPRRIQWSRQHPNPPGARYVGRGRGEHGKWGNPYAEGRIQHRDAYVDPDHIAAMYPANDGTVLHIAGQLSILRVNEHVTEIIRAVEGARQPPAVARTANPDQAYDDAAAALDAGPVAHELGQVAVDSETALCPECETPLRAYQSEGGAW